MKYKNQLYKGITKTMAIKRIRISFGERGQPKILKQKEKLKKNQINKKIQTKK